MKQLVQGFFFAFLMLLAGNLLAQEVAFTNEYELSVNPNPFENEVTIILNEGNKELTAIRICDILGKEVACIDLRNKSGVISYKLDFSQLPSGVYFCNVYGAGGIIETKRLSHIR